MPFVVDDDGQVRVAFAAAGLVHADRVQAVEPNRKENAAAFSSEDEPTDEREKAVEDRPYLQGGVSRRSTDEVTPTIVGQQRRMPQLPKQLRHPYSPATPVSTSSVTRVGASGYFFTKVQRWAAEPLEFHIWMLVPFVVPPAAASITKFSRSAEISVIEPLAFFFRIHF